MRWLFLGTHPTLFGLPLHRAKGHTSVVSDSPSDSRAEDRARLVERGQRALEALIRAAQSGSREGLEAANEEWEASGRAVTDWGLRMAAEALLRPPPGEAPAHE